MFVRDKKTGQLIRVNPGMSNEQYERIMSTLPEAELAGAIGPGVVPPQGRPQGGIVRQPPPTWRPLGGAAENNRGNTVIIAPPNLTAGGNPGSTFALNATVVETPRDAMDAETIAVCLSSAPVNASDVLAFNTALITESFVQLTWGIGGASFVAEVDVVSGLCLVLPASFIRVKAFYNGQNTGAGVVAVPQLSFSAGLAYGYLGQGAMNAARRTVSLDTVNNGAAALTPVPPFAVGYTLMATGAPTLQVDQLAANNAAATPLARHTMTTNANTGQQNESFVPLRSGTRALLVTNTGGVPNTLAVLWNLSL